LPGGTVVQGGTSSFERYLAALRTFKNQGKLTPQQSNITEQCRNGGLVLKPSARALNVEYCTLSSFAHFGMRLHFTILGMRSPSTLAFCCFLFAAVQFG
jgi:hypothetical protein